MTPRAVDRLKGSCMLPYRFGFDTLSSRFEYSRLYLKQHEATTAECNVTDSDISHIARVSQCTLRVALYNGTTKLLLSINVQ